MKISTKLKIAALAPLAMAVVVGVSIWVAHGAIRAAKERGQVAERIIRSMNNLHSLVGIYSLHHEERAREQFLAEHAVMAPILASVEFSDPEQERLRKMLSENVDGMKETFLRMAALHERAPVNGRSAGFARDEDRLAGQLFVRSSQAVSDGLRLEGLVQEEIAATQSRINVLVPLLILLVTLPLTLLLLRMMNRIARGLGILREGTLAVGQRSLGHRIGLEGEDELAGLGLAFDEMTKNLEALTVSRNELEQEVTERRKTEEALEKAKNELATINANLERLVQERTAKLQELVAELEHFSYTITHDMRAPLRGMQGFSELMEESCLGCQRRDSLNFLERIRTSAGRMDSLIRDALSYSQAVRRELPLETIDAGALLRGMLDSYPELQTCRADISIRGELPLVMANEAGLTQCFSNLLGNAVKFVKPEQRPQIRIWGYQREGWVRIWVEDEGIGIPGSMLPRMFEMFSRGHSGYDGTGIGLALVRKVAQRMGGRVGVESEEGKGSRFWLELRPGDVRQAFGELVG